MCVCGFVLEFPGLMPTNRLNYFQPCEFITFFPGSIITHHQAEMEDGRQRGVEESNDWCERWHTEIADCPKKHHYVESLPLLTIMPGRLTTCSSPAEIWKKQPSVSPSQIDVSPQTLNCLHERLSLEEVFRAEFNTRITSVRFFFFFFEVWSQWDRGGFRMLLFASSLDQIQPAP